VLPVKYFLIFQMHYRVKYFLIFQMHYEPKGLDLLTQCLSVPSLVLLQVYCDTEGK
jgi:hypothetical protein